MASNSSLQNDGKFSLYDSMSDQGSTGRQLAGTGPVLIQPVLVRGSLCLVGNECIKLAEIESIIKYKEQDSNCQSDEDFHRWPMLGEENKLL